MTAGNSSGHGDGSRDAATQSREAGAEISRDDETMAGGPAQTPPPFSDGVSGDANRFAPLEAGPPLSVPGYRIVREVSRGGQAVVCEAVQVSTGRKVAIKIMREGPLASARERARFDREVQVLAALNHPNIVRVVDRGTTGDGSFFLSMDYVGGPPLDEWLANYYRQHPEGPPPSDPSELLRIFLKLCDAISAAHLRGIVHRDLKPANVRMDTESGEPVVLDFGLARTAFSEMTDEPTPQQVSITGQFLGSLPWASPEQAEGIPEKIDVRTDVYSLGVILYQMLTGRFPYQVAGTMRDVLDNILNATPSAPSLVMAAKEAREVKRRLKLTRAPVTGRLNPTIDAIVLKALAKHREDRYQSAGELARDIGNYLSGRPTIAGGGLPKRGNPWKAIAMTVVVVLTLVVGGAVAVMRYGSAGKGHLSADQRTVATPDVAAVVPAPEGHASGATTEGSALRVVLPEPVATTAPAAGTTTVTREPGDFRATFPPYSGPTGDPLSVIGMVPRPAVVPGIKSWTIETRPLRGAVQGAEYSPNGEMLAVAGCDGAVRVYDPRDKRLLHVWVGHDNTVNTLSWTREGKELCSASDDHICFWNVATGACRRIQGKEFFRFAALSRDGKFVASAWPLRVWDASTGEAVATGDAVNADGSQRPPILAHTLGWAADNRHIAFAADQDGGTVGIFDTRDGSVVRLGGPHGDVFGLEWSPDGGQLAVPNGLAVELWELGASAPAKTYSITTSTDSVRWSRKGDSLITMGANCWIVNLKTGATVHGPTGFAHLSWSADDKRIAGTIFNQGVHFLDPLTGSVEAQLPSGAPWADPVLTADGSRLAVRTTTLPRLLRTLNVGRRLGAAELPLDADSFFSWGQKGQTLLSADGANPPLVIDPSSGTVVRRLPGSGWVVASEASSAVAIVQRERMSIYDVNSAATSAPVDLESGLASRQYGSPASGTVAWSPDGQALATAHQDGSVHLWDRTGKPIDVIRSGVTRKTLHWLDAGAKLALCTGEQILLYDVAAHHLDIGFASPEPDAWSPDGTRGAFHSAITFLEVADLKTRKNPISIRVPGGDPWTSWWTTGGLIECAGPQTNTISIWDSATGVMQAAVPMNLHGSHLAVIGSEGHVRMTPGTEEELVYVVDTGKGQEMLRPEEFRKRYGWKE